MIHTVGEKVIYKDKYEGIITTRRPANNSPKLGTQSISTLR